MSSQPAPGRPFRGGRARPLALALLAVTMAAGCAGGTPPPGASGGGPATPASASPAVTPSASPTSSGAPGSPPPSSPVASPDLPAEPPAATLSGAAGKAILGALGGYTWGDGGSDAPWIVVRAARAAEGAGPWTAAFDPAVPATAWTAAWAPILDGEPGRIAGHAEGTDGRIAFAGPDGSGPWTLKLEVRFGETGRATYFWRLGAR